MNVKTISISHDCNQTEKKVHFSLLNTIASVPLVLFITALTNQCFCLFFFYIAKDESIKCNINKG